MLKNHVKVWIAGAQGQVGSAFAKMLDRTEVDVLMTDIEDVDITDKDAVELYADMNRPDIIINCAGTRGIDYCEQNKDMAYKVNALGARNLSVVARSIRAFMVQISTDDVFDGNATEPYDEFAPTTPLTTYGKSKLAGENYVKEMAQKHLIIRSSWMYGDGDNFVTSVLEKAKNGQPIRVSKKPTAAPTSAEEVAKVIYRLLEHNANGTYHAVCQGQCNRYEFARKIVELAGYDPEIVEVLPEEEEKIGRHPSYAVLDNLMLRISGIELPPAWEKALSDYISK